MSTRNEASTPSPPPPPPPPPPPVTTAVYRHSTLGRTFIAALEDLLRQKQQHRGERSHVIELSTVQRLLIAFDESVNKRLADAAVTLPESFIDGQCTTYRYKDRVWQLICNPEIAMYDCDIQAVIKAVQNGWPLTRLPDIVELVETTKLRIHSKVTAMQMRAAEIQQLLQVECTKRSRIEFEKELENLIRDARIYSRVLQIALSQTRATPEQLQFLRTCSIATVNVSADPELDHEGQPVFLDGRLKHKSVRVLAVELPKSKLKAAKKASGG